MVQNQSMSDAVPGPDGKMITLKDLPEPSIRRWVTRRKAEVVAAVRGGLLSMKDACERYNLSEEEFSCWETLYDRHGAKGLRVTRVQQYRS